MSFVTISENKVTTSSMRDQIDATINYTRAYADEMRVNLSKAVEELQELVGTYDPTITDVDTSLTPIDKPVFPSKPILPDYDATCILNNLVTTICRNITEGGTGLTEPVYNAIIAREQGARRIDQEREYRNSLDAVGSNGFDLPSGHVTDMQIELSDKRIEKNQDALDSLRIKDFDLATENTRFSITAGMELEKTLQDSWNAAAGRTVDMYKAETDGIAAEYNALVSWVSAEVERIKMEATVAIENGRLGLEAYTSSTALAEKVAESVANIAAQSIASALSAINTQLSNSYTAREGRSEAWTHGDRLTESHNYEEE